jgi:hypothetical protein
MSMNAVRLSMRMVFPKARLLDRICTSQTGIDTSTLFTLTFLIRRSLSTGRTLSRDVQRAAVWLTNVLITFARASQPFRRDVPRYFARRFGEGRLLSEDIMVALADRSCRSRVSTTLALCFLAVATGCNEVSVEAMPPLPDPKPPEEVGRLSAISACDRLGEFDAVTGCRVNLNYVHEYLAGHVEGPHHHATVVYSSLRDQEQLIGDLQARLRIGTVLNGLCMEDQNTVLLQALSWNNWAETKNCSGELIWSGPIE